MKRWQDCGEVQDSDEEDLSLGGISQSPEHPRKKPKLGQGKDHSVGGRVDGTRTVTDATVDVGNDADENGVDWLQAQVAATYGRRIQNSICEDPHGWREKTVSAGDCSAISSTERQGRHEERLMRTGTEESQVSRPANDEELPEVDQLLRRPYVVIGSAAESDSPLSSVPSSPLSEREVSPLSEAELRSSRLDITRPASLTTNGADDAQHASIPDGRRELDDHGSMPMERRTFRARNEKQLHPYMFDLAQYQKQFRERGLRPVRYVEIQQVEDETQNASFRGDENRIPVNEGDSSKSSPGWSSSTPEDDSQPALAAHQGGTHPHASPEDDDLPDMSDLVRRPEHGTFQNRHKRRKVQHSIRRIRNSTSFHRDTSSAQPQDEFSVPPSPPSTSSDHAATSGKVLLPTGFRLPCGMSPGPLPTPQISSDIRGHIRDHSGFSDSDHSERQSRSSEFRHREHQAVPLDHSSESAEEEIEDEVDERALVRERKRIRGVLPASWLKIDRHAQQKRVMLSLSPERRGRSASPPAAMPQKGVARRVVGSRTRLAAQPIIVSDGDDDEDSLPSSPRPFHMRQIKLQFEGERTFATERTELVDDGPMEVDWIDPMFAASSVKRNTMSTRKRQPRITEALGKTQRRRDDFAEERRGLRSIAGVPTGRTGRRRRYATGRTPTSKHHRLSILDAPDQRSTPRQSLPPFVRLAMRTARHWPDRGRHSPSRKQIRLATMEDTEDAATTLRAWRDGTVVPRTVQPPGPGLLPTVDDLIPTNAGRFPLAEVTNNTQQRLPAAVRKEESGRSVRRPQVSVQRTTRAPQTSLTSFMSIDEERPTQPQTPHAAVANFPTKSDNIRRVQSHRTQPAKYRSAQLESLETDFHQQHRAAAFERRIELLTEGVALASSRRKTSEDHLARFLRDASSESAHLTSNEQESANDSSKPSGAIATSIALPHRRRKHSARRIDAEAREYRQPSEPLPEVADIEDDPDVPLITQETRVTLQGLGPFGTKYATDFDMLPLSVGTYFHESSFIGSGDFGASLDLVNRDLDTPTGRIRVHVDGDVLEWGPWTEEVATGLTRVLKTLSSAIGALDQNNTVDVERNDASLVLSNVEYLLRSVVRYFARCLSFLDMVDRRTCIQHLQNFVETCLEIFTDQSIARNDTNARCLQYALVLAQQTSTLCDHPIIQLSLKEKGHDLLVRTANRLGKHIFPRRFGEVKRFLEANKHATIRDTGIRDSDTAVCSIVILRHVLQSNAKLTGVSFWDIVHQTLNVNEVLLRSVLQLDNVWYNLFAILPILELDEHGLARIGSRMHLMPQDWSLVRRFVDQVFELYSTTSRLHGLTLNDYIRATLSRCYGLTARWGWWECETVLGTIFDFFARRGLAQLHKEESRGSPRFLSELDSQPSLELQPEDRSFHLFLKLLATGLRGMQKHGVYSDKKIGSIAWRFIPNHGRAHQKDNEVRQEDLDALRNHHDLLCTLYYATPPAHRLRVDLIRALVDHSTSHREACRLNVRAWANLATFQASTQESVEKLDAFAYWYRDVLSTTISQYRLARTEAEHDVAIAIAQGQLPIPRALIEDTIAANQQQIAATLVDALAAVKRALRASSSLAVALRLLEGSSFWQVFDIFELSSRRLRGVVEEALEVVKAALQTEAKFFTYGDRRGLSDDSQDYGDSTAVQELASTQQPASLSDHTIADVVHAPMAHLLSNVFGADATCEDTLLVKIVDVWTSIVHVMVRTGRRSRSNYINDYTSEAWTQLRDTEQKRKFTPYFLACIVESSDVDVAETDIFGFWLNSLVEREALLKYQHRLTNSLLNHCGGERLLQNLPFTQASTNHFEISLYDLRQRRVSLMSTVFSNMREDFEQAMYDRPKMAQGLRKTYAELLKHLMQAMKQNYQDLQAPGEGEVASAQVQGAYVEFVQQIISSMQQYTADICQVDRFFTDSTAFPLPAGDPMYVVGRLRAYVPKLAESRKRKELAVFIQTVSERAAVDNQQAYLVNQLVSAMTGVLERGNSRTPSLRHVLLTSLLPAYIENALSTACSWIMSLPVLQACGRVAEDLLYCVIWEDTDSIQAALDTLRPLLQSMRTPLEMAMTHVGQMRLLHVQAVLAAVFVVARQSLTGARYLSTSTRDEHCLRDLLDQYYSFAGQIGSHLSDGYLVDICDIPAGGPSTPFPWSDTLEFSRRQIRDKLSNDWYAHDGQYYVKRGSTSTEVTVALGDEEDGRRHLLESMRAFQESYEVVFGIRRRNPTARDSTMLHDAIL